MPANPLVPFSQIEGQLPPLIPNPADIMPPAPVNPDEGGMVKLPKTQGPSVQKAATPEETNLANDQQKLQKVQWQEANPWGTANNHPGVGGKIAHVLSKIGNVAGEVAIPNVLARIPGTDLNRQEQEGELVKRINQEQGQIGTQQAQESENELHKAQTAEAQERTAEMPSEEAEKQKLNDAQIVNLLHPQAKTDFEAWRQQNPSAPIEDWLKAQAAAKSETQGNDFEKFYKDYITDNNLPDSAHNRMLARKDWAAASQAPQRPPQVTVINSNGQVESLHPGQTIAPGASTLSGYNAQQNANLKDQQSEKAGEAALRYGTNYISSGKFTGPGDEALLEKYFELAKPSSGFRMTQNQMDMLQNSRSWMGSAEGQAYHAKTGTWFSPEQRQQIVQTMGALQEAKNPNGPKAGGNSESLGETSKPDGVYEMNGKQYRVQGGKVYAK